jgi:hypothetical protein
MKTLQLTKAQLSVVMDALLYWETVLDDQEAMGELHGRELRSLKLVVSKIVRTRKSSSR